MAWVLAQLVHNDLLGHITKACMQDMMHVASAAIP